MPTAYSHCSVLLEPAIDALLDPGFGRHSAKRTRVAPRLGGVYVDGTFGRGGHSRRLLQRLSSDASLLVFDKDPEAIDAAQALQREDARVCPVHASFADLGHQLDRLGISWIDGMLLDLGVSSPQLDAAARGFSFMRDGPLDMRMDSSRGQTAAQWLAQADEEQIKEVIAHYGEERFAFQIAKALVVRRQSRPLRTTGELAELITRVVRTREKGQHPATRTFQAIRIHINGELEDLAHTLPVALSRLRPGGRLVAMSFHSLEDRLVKQCLAAAAHPGQTRARLPIAEKDMPQPFVVLLARVKAGDDERSRNPRARSVMMRVAERTAVPLTEDQARAFVRLPGRLGGRRPSGRRA